MNKVILRIGLILILLTGFTTAAWAQPSATFEKMLSEGSVELPDLGIIVHHKLTIEPAELSNAFRPLGVGLSSSGGRIIRRFIYDAASETYFGFDMTLKRVMGTNSIEVSFGPLTITDDLNMKAIAGDKPMNAAPQPRFPAPQTVREGDTILFNMMTSSDGRARIVEYFRFELETDAKDFTIDDMPLNFTIDPPGSAGASETHVLINNQEGFYPLTILPSHGGSTVWLAVPRQGRFLLSLAPREGFQKAGRLQGTSLRFRGNGTDYEIRAVPVPERQLSNGPPDKEWNLYVKHEPRYIPPADLTGSMVLSIDRLDNLLPKRP